MLNNQSADMKENKEIFKKVARKKLRGTTHNYYALVPL